MSPPRAGTRGFDVDVMRVAPFLWGGPLTPSRRFGLATGVTGLGRDLCGRAARATFCPKYLPLLLPPLSPVREKRPIHEIRAPSPNALLLLLFGHRKAVPEPRFGQQVTGLGRLRLDFLAQLVNEDPQVLYLISVVRSPDGL